MKAYLPLRATGDRMSVFERIMKDRDRMKEEEEARLRAEYEARMKALGKAQIDGEDSKNKVCPVAEECTFGHLLLDSHKLALCGNAKNWISCPNISAMQVAYHLGNLLGVNDGKSKDIQRSPTRKGKEETDKA